MNKKTIEMYFGSDLYEAYIPENLFSPGMGHVILSRKTKGGAVVGVAFLCDHFCLGVKDCLAFMENEAGYRALIHRVSDNARLTAVPAGTVKKYVTDLVQWAREIGFEPHADYRFCSKILQGIPIDETATFTYGKDGVPTYVNGPYEDSYRIKQTISKLEAYKQRTGNKVDFTIIMPDLPLELL